MTGVTFRSIHPIGNADPMDLPVDDVGTAAEFYTEHLGMEVQSMDPGPPRSVTLRRDGVRMRLCENGGDPASTSCYIEVGDVPRLRAALLDQGLDVSEERSDSLPSGDYRVFFLRAPDGLCYCLGAPE